MICVKTWATLLQNLIFHTLSGNIHSCFYLFICTLLSHLCSVKGIELYFFIKQALMWLVVSRELNFLIILVFFLNSTDSFDVWIKQIQRKSTIYSNSSMNSLWFLNKFTLIPQWIHLDSSINSLRVLNKFIRNPQ